jgi:preprotein translocase subunit Sec61beta
MYLSASKQSLPIMSSKKKNAPLPASSAGLLRFFEDETRGVKVKPEIVLAVAGSVIAASILIRILFPVG